jgi:hemolysin D
MSKTKLESEFLSEAIEIVEKPASPLGHFVVFTIVAAVIAFFIWACFGQMDEIAVATATIAPRDGMKVIQPLYEGVITDIMIEEGDRVTKGQEMIILDTTTDEMSIDNTNAKIAELEFENELLNKISNGGDITSYITAAKTPEELQVIELITSMQDEQNSVLEQLNSQYTQYINAETSEKTTLERLQKDLTLTTEQRDKLIATYAADSPQAKQLDELRKQSDIMHEQFEDLKILYQSGAVAKAELEEMQKNYELLKAQIATAEATLERSAAGQNTEIDSLNKQIDLLNADIITQQTAIKAQQELAAQVLISIETQKLTYSQKIAGMIVDNNKQLADLRLEADLRSEQRGSQVLTAPTDGTVQALAVNTVGGVVTSAQALVSIVPADAELIVEAQVLNRDIGFVFVGQEVAVKLDAFSFQEYGKLNGTVTYISPAATEDERLGLIYKVKITIDRDYFDVDGKQIPISAGMSGTAEIVIDKRPVIEFFLEPIAEYFDNSLKLR